MRLAYDNSAENPNNPNDPPQKIRWGEQSTDEMGSLKLLLVAVDERDTPALLRSIREHVRDHFLQGLEAAAAGRFVATGVGRRTIERFAERLERLDGDRNGDIDFEERGSRFGLIADLIDTDGDGVLSSDELEAIAERLGIAVGGPFRRREPAPAGD